MDLQICDIQTVVSTQSGALSGEVDAEGAAGGAGSGAGASAAGDEACDIDARLQALQREPQGYLQTTTNYQMGAQKQKQFLGFRGVFKTRDTT